MLFILGALQDTLNAITCSTEKAAHARIITCDPHLHTECGDKTLHSEYNVWRDVHPHPSVRRMTD